MHLLPQVPKWTIRKKLLNALAILAIVIAVLGYSSFRGVYAYRDLAVTLSSRASEMPLTAELTRAIDELRNEQSSISIREPMTFRLDPEYESYRREVKFTQQLRRVGILLARYQARLEASNVDEKFLSDRTEELEVTEEIRRLFTNIYERHHEVGRTPQSYLFVEQTQDLEQLSSLAHSLPTLLTKRMASFREEVRNRYRTWIGLTWGSAILAASLLVGLVVYAKIAVIRPFKDLLAGARKVGAGDFNVRLVSETKDELAELANAINRGVESFLNIQRDLNQQVEERSREVIRNEQLASVGFLAAGVAHEINNPLASIAWSAEALESRLHRILPEDSAPSTSSAVGTDIETLKKYLKRIQDEAFRCKGITERLLDFSRLNQEEKRTCVDMTEIVEDVVSMVRHLGQFRNKKITVQSNTDSCTAWASSQEMKQVVLNLLTNALESIDPKRTDGEVRVQVTCEGSNVVLSFEDNGCGMTEEVQSHLFEPFFTKRLDGRGTGLGLPITSRIIADHGGRIIVKNLGKDVGSRFEVHIPREPGKSQSETSNVSAMQTSGSNTIPFSSFHRFRKTQSSEHRHAA